MIRTDKPFFEIIADLEDRSEAMNEFRKEIIQVTGMSNPGWYSGKQRKKFSMSTQRLIAKHLKQPVSVLFPEVKKSVIA